MGVDLTLLPVNNIYSDSQTGVYTHAWAADVLDLNRCSGLWADIRDLPSVEMPVDFNSHMSRDGECEENHFGRTSLDSYDERIRAVRAGDLARLKDHYGVQQFSNAPAWAYICALPPDGLVALYWG